MRTRTILILLAALLFGVPASSAAQFGRNKVQYDRFDFKVLETPHFAIYYDTREADAAAIVGRMAERWYARLSTFFGHQLSSRQPVVLYASHPDFEQTNVVEGELGEGTGGVTEGGKRRVTLPMAASLGDTDHVLGHELVHAFQYDMLDRNVEGLPLWFIEGMAEYLSLGSRDVQTAMWLRDAAIENRLPRLKDLDDPRYFPYRFGHALWAYIGGRWGDETIASIVRSLRPTGEGFGVSASAKDIIESATGMKQDEFSAAWQSAIREAYGIPAGERVDRKEIPEGVIRDRAGAGSLSVGPSLSPDGTKVAFLSERSQISIDLFIADVKTGRILRKVIDTAADPHFESLQFIASAGAWDAKSERLAIAAIRAGHPVLAIADAVHGGVAREIPITDLDEVFQPAWSPDGTSIAFAGQVNGFTDLYVCDVRAGTVRRLTNDHFADLEPSWSPDGKRLAFVTDRFTSNLETLEFHGVGLATVAVDGGAPQRVETGLSGSASNPQWAASGDTIYFLSDSGGRQNVWRLNLGAATPVAERITDEKAGVAGVTPLSPALSVSGDRGAVSVFSDAGYEIHFIDPSGPAVPAASASTRPLADAAQLPPLTRTSVVTEQLNKPEAGLPPQTTFDSKDYSPKLGLVGIGQQVGVATGGGFGTYATGGAQFQFSDVLGNHLLNTGFALNGGVRDVAISASYLNRTSRWNWGLFGERVPILSGTVSQGLTVIDGQTVFVERDDLFRETYTQTGLVSAYPFSRTSRLEFSGAVQRISFNREVHLQVFDPVTGVFLGEDRTDLPAGDALNLVDVSTALVRDTSVFGGTGPILGQRLRAEVGQTSGDLTMTNLTIDLRHYAMPFRPVTFAGRLVHLGRYGSSGEDERLTPLFLGYPTLVRGYDVNSFSANECTLTADGRCPEFDRLLGSRLLVFNGEVRAPAIGLFKGRLDYGPLPIELFGFVDAGLAWTKAERPEFANGTRAWVTSAGAGVRVNLLGFAIGEFNLVKPLSRPLQGWMFVFNLRPGF